MTFLRQAADLVGSGRQLALLLEVDERTVSRWLTGTSTPRPGVITDVREILRKRAGECLALAQQDERP